MRWLLPGVAVAAALAGCTGNDEPIYQPDPDASAFSTEYDPDLEPSAAALALVPAEATTLEVTDFDQLRLTLGFGELDRRSPQSERDKFWRAVSRAPSLSSGLLRPAEDELEPYGIGPDDVAWEATYAGGVNGWVISLHDNTPVERVRAAIADRIGPLAGAVLDDERRLVSSTELPVGDESWAAIDGVPELVGQEANATYVERACLPFDTVFGRGMKAQLAEAPRATLKSLDPLDGYSVALGTELVTARLGEARLDAFARLRLSEVMPATRPEFGRGFARGVADPASGRLGFDLQSPQAAIELVEDRHLPFAVCDD